MSLPLSAPTEWSRHHHVRLSGIIGADATSILEGVHLPFPDQTVKIQSGLSVQVVSTVCFWRMKRDRNQNRYDAATETRRNCSLGPPLRRPVNVAGGGNEQPEFPGGKRPRRRVYGCNCEKGIPRLQHSRSVVGARQQSIPGVFESAAMSSIRTDGHHYDAVTLRMYFSER